MKVISQYIVSKKNAGPKAKMDIEKILKDKYNARICTYKIENNKNRAIKKYLFMRSTFKNDDIAIIQLPFTSKIKYLNKINKKIGIIHDVDGIRFNDTNLLSKEVKVFNTFNALIVHNDVMMKTLKKAGVTTPMIALNFFDYLIDNGTINSENRLGKNPIIIYPGNLEKRKSEFLYELDSKKMDFLINVYGPGYDNSNNEKIVFKGSFSPNELPYKLYGNLGLVWSGKLDSSDEDIGEKGYNKYNYPHKLSSYIVAKVPVIVWRKAAVAHIVNKYDIGYVIDNIYDINKLDFSDYDVKKRNVEKLSQKIMNGYFITNAVEKALEIIKEK